MKEKEWKTRLVMTTEETKSLRINAKSTGTITGSIV
jgi:hypothetical protein